MDYIEHFGVYAAIRQDGKMLLTQQAIGVYQGQWDLPGGRMDRGETMEESLRREIAEETGYDMTSCRQLYTNEVHVPVYDEQGEQTAIFHHIAVIYEAQVTGEMISGGNGEDSAALVWWDGVDTDDVTLTPHARLVWDMIKKLEDVELGL